MLSCDICKHPNGTVLPDNEMKMEKGRTVKVMRVKLISELQHDPPRINNGTDGGREYYADLCVECFSHNVHQPLTRIFKTPG